MVQRNLAQRYGHDAVVVNATGSMAKIGTRCYSISDPLITIQRGQQISEVECPGKVDWWARDQLDEIAQYRGIP